MGLAALAAAAAAYFFAGPQGKKNRAQAKRWVAQAKRDVVKELRRAKAVNQGSYDRVVDSVMGKYRKLKKVSPAEAAAAVKELKDHWRRVSTAMKVSSRRPARKAGSKKARGKRK